MGWLIRSSALNSEDESSAEIPAGENDKENEKVRAKSIAKQLNKKLMAECISMAKEIAKNSLQCCKGKQDVD